MSEKAVDSVLFRRMPSNNKTFFVERTDFSLRMARLASGPAGDTIEDVREIAPNSPEETRAFVQDFAQEKGTNLVRAYCAIYPSGRLLRNASFKDGPILSDAIALEEAVAAQFQINPADYAITALNTDDGFSFTPGKVQKELLVCGAPREQLREAQDFLVAAGIYPLRLELGSVATVGLLLSNLRLRKIQDPVLVLEIGSDSSHVLILNENRLESAKPLPLGLNSMIAGVRKELGLKDEQAARRLFYSDSFDFREMGPRLIDRLLRELQSMIGFYEVQTGQSITRMLCGLLPAKLGWLNQTFSSSLGMSRLELEIPALLAQSNLNLAEADPPLNVENPLGLLGLMINQEVKV